VAWVADPIRMSLRPLLGSRVTRIRAGDWALPGRSAPYVLGVVFFVVTQLTWWGAVGWSPRLPGPFATADPGAAQLGLVQAHAALVAIAVPLLLLLVQVWQYEGPPLPRPASEVIATRAFIFPVSVMSVAITVRLGFDGLFWGGRTQLALDGGLFAVGLLALFGSYWRTLSLLFNRQQLRDAADVVLQRRLQHVAHELVVSDAANEAVRRHLEPRGVRQEPAPIFPGAGPQVRSGVSGVVVDLDPQGIASVVTVVPTFQPSPGSGPALGHAIASLHVRIGGRVNAGDPILTVHSSGVPLGHAQERRLQRFVRVE